VPVKLCRPTSDCSTWDKLAVENQHSFTNVNPSRNFVDWRNYSNSDEVLKLVVSN
jgi:hypothetical protein